ncbi:MAG: molybdopterin molybdotransferase MoeA, partial [Acidilobaceae archaeon]
MTLPYPEEAIDRVRGTVGYTIVERLLEETLEVDVRDLAGRLIAEPLKAPISLPPTLKSTLDGYAVRVGLHSSGPPLRLRLKGRSRIGGDVEASIGFGECFYVDTGARVPIGANAVIPVEDCERDGDHVIARRIPKVGEGLAMPASDIAEGDIVVYRGSKAYPEVAAALASLGYRRVKASRRVRVAVLAVGSELVEPGEPLKPGDVYESSRSYVISRFKLEGYDVIDMGIVGDDLDYVAEALQKAAGAADIVVTCGGTSMGVEDYTYKVIESRGSIVVRGLKVKPGKPTKVGVLGGSLVIALSGNPRAAVNVTESFIIPLLDRLGL